MLQDFHVSFGLRNLQPYPDKPVKHHEISTSEQCKTYQVQVSIYFLQTPVDSCEKSQSRACYYRKIPSFNSITDIIIFIN